MEIEEKNFQSQKIKVGCTMILSNHLIKENTLKRIPGKSAVGMRWLMFALPEREHREKWLCPFCSAGNAGAE